MAGSHRPRTAPGGLYSWSRPLPIERLPHAADFEHCGEFALLRNRCLGPLAVTVLAIDARQEGRSVLNAGWRDACSIPLEPFLVCPAPPGNGIIACPTP